MFNIHGVSISYVRNNFGLWQRHLKLRTANQSERCLQKYSFCPLACWISFSKGEAARKAENKSPEVPELLTNPNTQDDAEFVIRAEGGSGISREKFLLHQPPAETNKKIEPVTPGKKATK
jgi:hypothetical protein